MKPVLALTLAILATLVIAKSSGEAPHLDGEAAEHVEALPEASGAPTLNLGEKIKLDHLGPAIVNEDGTLRRITNWDKLSPAEQETAKRRLSERNQERTQKLKDAAKADGQATGDDEVKAPGGGHAGESVQERLERIKRQALQQKEMQEAMAAHKGTETAQERGERLRKEAAKLLGKQGTGGAGSASKSSSKGSSGGSASASSSGAPKTPNEYQDIIDFKALSQPERAAFMERLSEGERKAFARRAVAQHKAEEALLSPEELERRKREGEAVMDAVHPELRQRLTDLAKEAAASGSWGRSVDVDDIETLKDVLSKRKGNKDQQKRVKQEVLRRKHEAAAATLHDGGDVERESAEEEAKYLKSLQQLEEEEYEYEAYGLHDEL